MRLCSVSTGFHKGLIYLSGSAAEASRRVNAEPNDKLGPYTFPAIIANLEKLLHMHPRL